MARPPKRPREHVLETMSENFARRVLPPEWIAGKTEHDYGIDLQIGIVRNESVTGERFSIQLKGTDDLKIRKKTYIAHPCSTSALLYYLNITEPVIYLVYDAVKDEGYWIWIQEYIRNELDPKWRNKSGVTIRIPKTSTFDTHAIRKIAQKVRFIHEQDRLLKAVQTSKNPYYAYHFTKDDRGLTIAVAPRYPSAEIEHPVDFSGTFKFDQSGEGQAALAEFQRMIKTGSPVKLDSRFFEGFDFVTAFPDLFAHTDKFDIEAIELFPLTTGVQLGVKLVISDKDNNTLAEVPYVELRDVQSGSEETTYSNAHQNIPLKIKIVTNRETGKVYTQFNMDFIGQNVANISDMLHIRNALNRAFYFRMIDISTRQFRQGVISHGKLDEIDEAFESLIEDLVLIQEQKSVSLFMPENITMPEVMDIKKVASALRIGSYKEMPTSVTVTVSKETAQEITNKYKPSDELQTGVEAEDVVFTILGNDISLGRCRITFPRVKLSDKSLPVLLELADVPDDSEVKLKYIILEPGTVKLIPRS